MQRFLLFIPWTFQDPDALLARIHGVYNLGTSAEYIVTIARGHIMLPNIKTYWLVGSP